MAEPINASVMHTNVSKLCKEHTLCTANIVLVVRTYYFIKDCVSQRSKYSGKKFTCISQNLRMRNIASCENKFGQNYYSLACD